MRTPPHPRHRVGIADERVVDDILARLGARGGYDAFVAQVRAARCCRRPVRLQGRISSVDETGCRSVLFDSATLPDRVLLKACGTRREALCPPCASIYRGDAFQLVAAGLRGGKGVPKDIGSHPAVLLTLTAPSFGPVHRRQADGCCHPTGRRCPHGTALACRYRHDERDDALGSPLCSACYDYEGAVLFNASVSELWRRTTIYALRALGTLVGMSARATEKALRLGYVKVVEFQRRGSVHLHALVRVDLRGDELGEAPQVDPEMLASALRIAARKVSVPAPGDGRLRFSWGQELEVTVLSDLEGTRHRVAGYLGKYSTKGSDDSDVLARRLRAGVPNDVRLPKHLRHLVQTAWELSNNPEVEHLRLRLWAHTVGFRGHFLTKSRRWSTTFASLRAERQLWRLERRDTEEFKSPEIRGVVREWSYQGSGYVSAGVAILAGNLEEAARLGRRVAFEARRGEQER